MTYSSQQNISFRYFKVVTRSGWQFNGGKNNKEKQT